MFVDDIPVDGVCCALIIRSPVAKGKLKSVSCPALSPDFTLITAAGIPGKNSLFDAELPLLASDVVSYIGEPVALLTGPEPLELEEYAKACIIDIEEEQAEFSIEDAWEAEDLFMRVEREAGYPPKIKGDLVVEGHYETGIQEHWYSEPHGAVVFIDDGHFIIKTASQRPDDVRSCAAQILGIPESKVKVENHDLGIHLDGKIWYPSVIGSLAALAAFVTKKPVKLQLTREEDFLFSPKRTPSVIHLRSLLTFDGQILETDALIKIGLGAYSVLARTILDEVTRSIMNVYKTGKLTIETVAVRTNTPPAGPFAGFGSSITAFALERHISKITDTLEEESSQWRLSHLQHKLKGRFGEHEEDPHDIISVVSRTAGFKRKWAAYELLRNCSEAENEKVLPQRGIGIAFSLAEAGAETSGNNGGGFLFPREFAPAAACVIEIEIDRVNYEAMIRGVWLHVAAGKMRHKRKAELILRRAVLAALGWTSTEKIKYIDGKITPPLCALYQLLPASETPPIHLNFIEEEEIAACEDTTLEELPFSTVPAAYTQAISQAINYHFERIPITGQDVWRVITLKKLEHFEKKSHDTEDEESLEKDIEAEIHAGESPENTIVTGQEA